MFFYGLFVFFRYFQKEKKKYLKFQTPLSLPKKKHTHFGYFSKITQYNINIIEYNNENLLS